MKFWVWIKIIKTKLVLKLTFIANRRIYFMLVLKIGCYKANIAIMQVAIRQTQLYVKHRNFAGASNFVANKQMLLLKQLLIEQFYCIYTVKSLINRDFLGVK